MILQPLQMSLHVLTHFMAMGVAVLLVILITSSKRITGSFSCAAVEEMIISEIVPLVLIN